ncbi:MAG: prephenate dehydratase [Actinomycetes bacterium]
MSEKYAYLGPRGTFTEAALLVMPQSQGAELIASESVHQALEAVRNNKVVGALVPIENSVEGSVPTTLDELSHGQALEIVAEVAIPVTFGLLVRPGTAMSDIKRVATHPHAHAQCLEWLNANLPGVHVLPAMSTAAAAAELDNDATYQAAICSTAAASHYNLEILADDIGDNDAAWTRFILVRTPGHAIPSTGSDKTTVSLFMHEDHPGALMEILTEFAVRGINLTRIESRPTKKQLGDYFFSVDFEGHIDEERVGEAMKGLHRICADVKFLGSYPRHDGKFSPVKSAVKDSAFVEADDWLSGVRKRS